MPPLTHCLQCGSELPSPAKTGPRRKFCPGDECSRRYHNDKRALRDDPDREIKRRKPRTTLPPSDTCLYCGISIKHSQRRRFCCDEHGELWQNAQRNKGRQATFHWLSEIDEEARTATCAQCGPNTRILSAGTKLTATGKRKWKCRATAVTNSNQQSRWLSDWRKRGVHLTLERFHEMLVEQDGLCAVCSVDLLDEAEPRVDHDHETRRVRGLLCDWCNLGLGHFLDSPQRLRAAAAYLERSTANHTG